MVTKQDKEKYKGGDNMEDKFKLLREGSHIHNKLNQRIITGEEGKQLLDKWWDKVQQEEVDTNMILNLMLMYKVITEKLRDVD